MTPTHPIVEALVHRLDRNLREMFEERAGVLQFESGNPRDLAEPLALLDVLRINPLAVAGVVCLRTSVAGAPVVVIAATQGRARAAVGTLGGTRAVPTELSLAVASLGGAARLTVLD